MAEVNRDGIWGLVEVLRSTPETPSPNTTYGTVTRVDQEGTVWVHLPGGVDETPAAGLNVASVQPGDVVGIAIGGNSASVMGNASSPAVGEREVRNIVAPVEEAATVAQETATIAQQIAEEAAAVSGDTNNHFWDDSYGAHVTDVEEDEFNAAIADDFSDYDPDTKPYRNVLVGRLGILLRECLNNLVSVTRSAIAFFDGSGNNASNIVARFGASGAQIGKDADTHVTIDSDSLDIVDGTTTLATFHSGGASIGANSEEASIKLCDGKGVITGKSTQEYNENTLQVAAQRIINSAFEPDENGDYFPAEDVVIPYDSDRSESAVVTNTALLVLADSAPYMDAPKYHAPSSYSSNQVDVSTEPDNNMAYATWGASASDVYFGSGMSRQQATMADIYMYADETKPSGQIKLTRSSDQRYGQFNFNLGDYSMEFKYADGSVIKWNFTGSSNLRADYTPEGGTTTSQYFIRDGISAFVTRTVDVTIGSTAAGANTTATATVPSVSDCTPVGVVGWNINTGTRQNYFNVWRCHLQNSTTVRVTACNLHSSSAANGTITVYVLYARTAILNQ